MTEAGTKIAIIDDDPFFQRILSDAFREAGFSVYTANDGIEGVKLYCKYSQEKLPIFSLNFEGVNPYDISRYLSEHYQIQTRAGCSCAGPYGHDLLHLEDGQIFDEKPGWLRISIHYTHTKQEIDRLLKALKEAILALSNTK